MGEGGVRWRASTGIGGQPVQPSTPILSRLKHFEGVDRLPVLTVVVQRERGLWRGGRCASGASVCGLRTAFSARHPWTPRRPRPPSLQDTSGGRRAPHPLCDAALKYDGLRVVSRRGHRGGKVGEGLARGTGRRAAAQVAPRGPAGRWAGEDSERGRPSGTQPAAVQPVQEAAHPKPPTMKGLAHLLATKHSRLAPVFLLGGVAGGFLYTTLTGESALDAARAAALGA